MRALRPVRCGSLLTCFPTACAMASRPSASSCSCCVIRMRRDVSRSFTLKHTVASHSAPTSTASLCGKE